MTAPDTDRSQNLEEIFTCVRCEQNYTVPAGTTACPVCDWSHESAIRQQEFDTL
jgi:transcription elongation factor Elf1